MHDGRRGPGDQGDDLPVGLDHPPDFADAGLDRRGILRNQASPQDRLLQHGQGGHAGRGRVGAVALLLLEPQRRDIGRQIARGLSLVGRAGDVLGQPDQRLDFLAGGHSVAEQRLDEVAGDQHP